jgi:HAAS domain-containing protein
MTASTLHPLAIEWLDRLRAAAERLPASEREELVSDIEAHLLESIPPGASETEVREALDRLGTPEEIVAEAVGPVDGTGPGRGTHEWAAIVLVLAGGFLFGVGWIVGVVLLWTSRAWTVRDKLIGTLVVPGGLALANVFLLFGLLGASQVCTQVGNQPEVCHGGQSGAANALWIAALIAVIVLPILTAIYLARRADRPRPTL